MRRPRMRRLGAWSACALCAVLASGCLGSPSATSTPTGRAGNSPSQGVAPERVGSGYNCPNKQRYAALGSVFYPPVGPTTLTVGRRPDRCFASPYDAARAGFRRVATPLGDLLVDGVYLVKPSRRLTGYCRAGAAVVSFPIACPTLVPYPPSSVGLCDPVLRNCFSGGEALLVGYFSAPPGYIGIDGTSGGHLWIFSSSIPRPDWIFCCESTRMGRTKVHGRTAWFYSYPSGSHGNSSHVLLEWRQDGHSYAVSLHGRTKTNENLDRVIAQHLVYWARPS
jgi:hypothetical protein